MFDRCGPLMTDLVEVHGRDPHQPALLPPHPPSARVAAKQCCATLHKRLQSCKLFRVPFLFPNATHENAFSIGQTFARSPLLFWRERHCRLLALHFVLLCTASSTTGCKRTHSPQEVRHHRGNDGCFANKCKCYLYGTRDYHVYFPASGQRHWWTFLQIKQHFCWGYRDPNVSYTYIFFGSCSNFLVKLLRVLR